MTSSVVPSWVALMVGSGRLHPHPAAGEAADHASERQPHAISVQYQGQQNKHNRKSNETDRADPRS